MIFVNGADNPTSVFVGLTSLDNVYFNNTLVWSINAQSSTEYGTFEIPTSNAEDFGIDLGGWDGSSSGGSGGTNPYLINGTVTVSRSNGHADNYNNLAFDYFTMYRTPAAGQGDVIEEGIQYTGTLSTQMSWELYKPLGITSDPTDYLYCYADDGALSRITGAPSGTTLYEAHSVTNASVTMLVDLTGSPIFDPSRMTSRVYSCEVFVYPYMKGVRFHVNGDEYNICTGTQGLTYQGTTTLWLKFT